ncbi:MAG: FHA domain-containing protein [Myxococcales bacterium]|nr:FHA domain-containing protein [Myxococcales bacterium]
MSTEGPSPSYHFEVVNSSGDTHVYEISEPLCSLGTSEEEADILIDDPSLRPVHLILSFDGFRVRCRPVGGDIRIGSTVLPALTPFLLQNELRIDFGYSSLTLKQVVSGEDEAENLKTPPRGIRVDEIAALLGDSAPDDPPAPRASPPPAPVRAATESYSVPDADPVPEAESESTPPPSAEEWAELGREPEPNGVPADVEPSPTVLLVAAATVVPAVPAISDSEPEAACDPAPEPVIETPPPSVAAPAPPPAAPTAPPAAAVPSLAGVDVPQRRVDAPTAPGAVQVSTGAMPWDYDVCEVLFASTVAVVTDDWDPSAAGGPFRAADASLRAQAFALGCHGVAFTRFEQRLTAGSGLLAVRPLIEVFAYGTAVRRLR